MSKIGHFCESFLETCWLSALVLSAFFMNIYTQRMFEPDKAALIRSIAILMIVTWLIKLLETRNLVIRDQKTENLNHYSWNSIINSLMLPAGLFIFSYLISSALSVLPNNSFWGSYDRMEGLYTNLSYFVIFLIASTHIKTASQINRLITTIILTSVPVMIYGLIQKAGKDPVPWQSMDPSNRISSTMGNPIFLSAYLIVVVPMILARIISLIRRLIKNETDNKIPGLTWFEIGFYAVILLLHIIAVILTQSRGPLLGLIAGLVAFLLGYGLVFNKRLMLSLSLITLVLFGVFVALLNLPKTPLEPLKKIPILERLSKINPSEGSARTRMILWDNAYKMMRDNIHPPKEANPYNYSVPWRFVLGYGPETIGNIFYRYHTPELVSYEGATVHGDNCHDSVINIWVTQGVLGVITFLSLIIGVIFVGLKSIRRITDQNLQLITLGIVCAVVSHFVESLLGIQIVVTLTHLWLCIGMIYAISKLKSVYSSEYDALVVTPKTGKITPTGKTRQENGRLPLKTNTDNFTKFLLSCMFWTFIGVTVLLIYLVITEYWPNMGTDIVQWITGTYLYILFGILLSAFTLSVINKPTEASPLKLMQGSSFNIIPYMLLFVIAFGLIYYTNLNPILADGYYKFAYSADSEIMKNHTMRYQQAGGAWHNFKMRQQMGKYLSPDEQKEMQQDYMEYKGWITEAFKLRIISAIHLHESMDRAPMEPTYLNGAGRNYMEMARLWQISVDDNLITRKPNRLEKIPTVSEIIKFKEKDYGQFSQYDYMLCCLAVIKRAYEIEPTNFERLIAMGRVHQYMGTISPILNTHRKHYEDALRFYEEAHRIAPQHPVAANHVKEMTAMISGLPKQ